MATACDGCAWPLKIYTRGHPEIYTEISVENQEIFRHNLHQMLLVIAENYQFSRILSYFIKFRNQNISIFLCGPTGDGAATNRREA